MTQMEGMVISCSAEPMTLAEISITKCLLLGVATLALGIFPNLPGFGDNLVYSAIFYKTTLGVVLRLIACALLEYGGVVLLICGFRAIFGRTRGVWVENDEIKWGLVRTKHLSICLIQSASFDAGKKAVLLKRSDGGSGMLIPTLTLRSDDAPEPLVAKLHALISGR